MSKQRQKAYSGGMTMGTRKRIAKSVTIMTQAIKPRWITNPVSGRMQYHKFSFITLTVANPKNLTAREGYDKLLNHFLDWMTRTAAVENPLAKTYIWKAELQQRGQIHYHITTPAFIHWRSIRDKWNSLQRQAGLLDEYATKHGHFDPNSTDVHDTRSVKKMDRYLIKEMGKEFSARKLKARRMVDSLIKAGEIPEDKRATFVDEYTGQEFKTMGKVWGCSEDLAGVGYFTIGETWNHIRKIDQWIAEGKAWKKSEDFFAIVYCDGVDPPELLDPGERKTFEDYLKTIMTRTDQVKALEIPEACVQPELVNTLETYTVSQFALMLN
jgi:hypothetical protein